MSAGVYVSPLSDVTRDATDANVSNSIRNINWEYDLSG